MSSTTQSEISVSSDWCDHVGYSVCRYIHCVVIYSMCNSVVHTEMLVTSYYYECKGISEDCLIHCICLKSQCPTHWHTDTQTDQLLNPTSTCAQGLITHVCIESWTYFSGGTSRDHTISLNTCSRNRVRSWDHRIIRSIYTERSWHKVRMCVCVYVCVYVVGHTQECHMECRYIPQI